MLQVFHFVVEPVAMDPPLSNHHILLCCGSVIHNCCISYVVLNQLLHDPYDSQLRCYLATGLIVTHHCYEYHCYTATVIVVVHSLLQDLEQFCY
jgi:hypothetical protein